MDFILASASPRRQELLKLIKENFRVIPSDIAETVPAYIPVIQSPEFLAVKKAEAVAKENPESLVIGADTGVFSGGTVLGKPKDEAAAKDMLTSLSGKTHTVITGCAIFYKNRHLSFSEETLVEFYNLTEDEINAYIKTKSPFDKAGGYGIQDKGALFVKSIKGDYFNVVGLPVARLFREIKTLFKICGENYE